MGLPGGSDSKESACNAGELGSIPESGRSPGEGNSNPIMYSCLDRGAWLATVHGVAKTQLSDNFFFYICSLGLKHPSLKMVEEEDKGGIQ